MEEEIRKVENKKLEKEMSSLQHKVTQLEQEILTRNGSIELEVCGTNFVVGMIGYEYKCFQSNL